jgi:hypothetical protein
MERALFIAKSKNLKYFSSHLTRLYFGNEFCQRLLPSKKDVDRVMEFVKEKKCEFTLVTPYVTNEGLQNWKGIIEQVAAIDPRCEVIFNDWGLFRILQDISPGLKPVLGRLMTKIKRGPRLMKVMEKLPPDALKHLQSTNLSVGPYRTFLLDRGITRAELDHPFQDMKLDGIGSSIHLSLYIPFVYVTTTRFCLSASCDKPEAKGMVGILPCKKECQKYTFTLDNPVMVTSLIRKGNTIFFKNDKIPTADELRKKEIDRLVIQPEIPI